MPASGGRTFQPDRLPAYFWGPTWLADRSPASAGGEIEQSTEATLGPYELHDFILFHAVRCGYSPAKILTVSLSPRGDWRMPSDADAAEWLKWDGS